ncbi:MAG: low temperature requirement protein A [Bacteroidia bacterium]
MSNFHNNLWWGPPRTFSAKIAERKISWLELFYDLVYVIVISKITHFLAAHPEGTGLLDYVYLFAMTFWGWYNGSMYHDLHATPGIRNRFMTLWQMMAVGALAVTLDSPPESLVFRATFALLFLQLFITYLWWSVGIYDKTHRKLNRPYTVCYLVAFMLLLTTIYAPPSFQRFIFWSALVLNYTPYVLTAFRLRKAGVDLSLSSNMTERLGLFVIIVFGEAILGVVNSASRSAHPDFALWMRFGMGILIVFALWWIFFAIIADRECKKGMLTGTMFSMIYIPALASLGMVGAAFPALLGGYDSDSAGYIRSLQLIYGVSIMLFLCSVTMLSRFLHYPPEYEKQKGFFQAFLAGIGAINIILVLLLPMMPVFLYLVLVFGSLLIVIIMITRSWFRIELNKLVSEDKS